MAFKFLFQGFPKTDEMDFTLFSTIMMQPLLGKILYWYYHILKEIL
jgi:hypothetical protein